MIGLAWGRRHMFSTRLETLLMVAEKQNFTQAAQALSLTQPAVSHHISSLEEELGVRLFQRGKNRLLVTPEGEIVLRYARRARALYEKMGFRITGVKPNAIRLKDGTLLNEYSMIREIRR